MRLDQDKKLKPRRLISRILRLLIFNTHQFLKGTKSQWRKVFIFLLIFSWLFSGWPQIQEVHAATLSTLRPTADGTINAEVVHDAGASAPFYTHIDDDPDSPTVSDWVANSQNESAASAFFDVTDTPADFNTMSALEIKIDFGKTTFDDDTAVLYAQMYQSNESTTLSDEMQLATQVTAAGLITVSFTNVTAGSKTIWDGARIRFRWTYTKSKGPDNGQLKITAAELNGIYTASAATVSCSTEPTQTGFQTLTTDSIFTATSTATTTMSCTYTAGCTLYVKDTGDTSNPGLYSSGASDLINSAQATLSAGTEGYGIQAATTSAGTGVDLLIDAAYKYTGDNVGAFALTNQTLTSASGTFDSKETVVTFKATISGLNKPGNYVDTITFECLGN